MIWFKRVMRAIDAGSHDPHGGKVMINTADAQVLAYVMENLSAQQISDAHARECFDADPPSTVTGLPLVNVGQRLRGFRP